MIYAVINMKVTASNANFIIFNYYSIHGLSSIEFDLLCRVLVT